MNSKEKRVSSMWGDTCRPDTTQITSLRPAPQRGQLRPSHKEGEHDEGLASNHGEVRNKIQPQAQASAN